MQIKSLKKIFLIVLLNHWVACSYADDASNALASDLAPGYRSLQFAAPAPGTYSLPKLGLAGDGNIVNSDNSDLTLHQLYGDKIVLLSFIYSTCSDVNGCPLATMVLHKIKGRLQKESELQSKLRLLTLSFNPSQDTPDRMKAYGEGLQGNGVEWQFLTTRSERDLQPLLSHYPQKIQKVYDVQGRFTGTFTHDLRVYLIDTDKQIRNIYSITFLHPDTLINDIKTLLLNQTQINIPKITNTALKAQDEENLYRAGDNKNNYASSTYQTHSIALADRKGRPLNLFQVAQQTLLGLPPLPVPQDNPLTAAKIALGRKLFYDRRLSLNNTFSCAMCHVPEQGFTSNEMTTSVGIEGRSVRRNAPTLYNIAYAEQLFHDGRETSLEQQVWGPLLAFNEMANPAVGQVIAKINQQQDYQGLFEQAFGRPAGMETVGMALASYERTLNSADSAFDRRHFGKQTQAISLSAQRGFDLFKGKAHCASCHTVASDYALFTDRQLHNTGIGYLQAMAKTPEFRKVQLAPGVFVDVKQDLIKSVGESQGNDLGQYEITQNPAHRWKYKTPSLRNIGLTGPYMHNGALTTLEEVVNFYDRGGIANENLDPLIKPLGLNQQEKADLVAFLNSLTGSNVIDLVADAFAAPIGDTRQ